MLCVLFAKSVTQLTMLANYDTQFLCPFTNARTDEYGGDVINRLRFPLRVLDKIRSAVGKSFTIVVKMNVTDALPRMYNMSLEDAIACAQAFETHGADALVLSGGMYR